MSRLWRPDLSERRQSMRVLICNKHGGFGLSYEAFLRLRELGCEAALAEPDIGEMWSDGSGPRESSLIDSFGSDIARSDPLLLQVFDEMGQGAAARFCHLAAVEIPDGVSYTIEEYGGFEWVAETHRTWHAEEASR